MRFARSGEFRTSLTDGNLKNKITFMTSAYFAGVDVNEKCHVYAVSDTSYLFSLLLKAKIYQIFGRARRGVLSQSFIFNTNESYYRDIKDFIGWLDVSISIINTSSTPLLIRGFSSAEEETKITKTIEGTIRNNIVHDVELARLEGGEIVRNALNIDYLYHRQRAMNLLYTDVERTRGELSNVFDVVFEVDDTGMDDDELRLLDTLKTDSHTNKQTRAMRVLEGPYGTGGYITPKNEFERTLHQLMAIPQKGKVASKVKKLVKEVILDHNCHQGKLNRVLQNLLVYRMTTLQEPQKALERKFKIGDSYTSSEIHIAFIEMAGLKTLSAYSDILPSGITQKKAVELFNKIFATERSSRTIEESGKTDAYKIYKKNIQFQENI